MQLNNQSTNITDQYSNLRLMTDLSSGEHYNAKTLFLSSKKQKFFQDHDQSDSKIVTTIQMPKRVKTVRYRESMQKMKIALKGMENLQINRKSETAGINRRRPENIKTQSKTLNLTPKICLRQGNSLSASKHKYKFQLQQRKQNKFNELQKKYNKGPFKDRYLTTWLNSLIMQTTDNQKFDSSFENSALIKYGIDQNSLRAKGLKSSHVTRVYRTLFVYSIGFNDLLDDICEKNMNLRLTIWTVYAVLLQYCGKGSFENVLNQMKKDNIEKVQRLQNDALEKQRILDNYDEINQEKNMKLVKQIKSLRQAQEYWLEERKKLREQIAQTTQSFNQQVSLRLKFQHRINEIHGLNVQMHAKHDRLNYDYQITTAQYEKFKTLSHEQGVQIVDLKMKVLQLKKVIDDLQQKILRIQQSRMKDHQKMQYHKKKEEQLMKKVKFLQINNQGKARDLTITQTSLNSSEQLFKNKNLIYDEIVKQLNDQMRKGQQLIIKMKNQTQLINQLLEDKNNFGKKTAQIQGQVKIFRERVVQRDREIKELKNKIESITEELQKSKRQSQGQRILKAQLEVNIKEDLKGNREMRSAKILLEQELEELKKKFSSYNEVIRKKDAEIKQLKNNNQLHKKEIDDLKISIAWTKSKNQCAMIQKQKQVQILTHKNDILKHQKQKVQKQCLQLQFSLQPFRIEKQKLQTDLKELNRKFLNQKFQRHLLLNQNKNILDVQTQKINEVKQLIKSKSLLEQAISEIQNKYKVMEKKYREKERYYEKQIVKRSEDNARLIQQNKERIQYVHPMLYEDLAERYLNIKNKVQEIENMKNKQISKLKKQVYELYDKCQQKQSTAIEQIKNLKKEYNAKILRKQEQLEYEMRKSEQLKQKYNDTKTQLEKYEVSGAEKSIDKEQKYLSKINRIKKQMEQIQKQLRVSQQNNITLSQEIHQLKQVTIAQKQKELLEVKKELIEEKRKFEQEIIAITTELEMKEQEIQKYQHFSQDISQIPDNQKVVSTQRKTSTGKVTRDRIKYQELKQEDSGFTTVKGRGKAYGTQRDSIKRCHKTATIYYSKK